MVTTCPKCHRTDTNKAETHAGHHAAHSQHGLLHGWPIMGLVGLALSALSATGVMAEWVCRKCGHRFGP